MCSFWGYADYHRRLFIPIGRDFRDQQLSVGITILALRRSVEYDDARPLVVMSNFYFARFNGHGQHANFFVFKDHFVIFCARLKCIKFRLP